MGSSSRFVSRGLLTALAVALTGVVGLAVAPGAWADVTITPTQAEQGGAANVTFKVADDRGTAYTTKVEVLMSQTAPVGEAYPLSVDGWAPVIKYRQLPQPIQGIHGTTNTIMSSVTWTRVVTKKPPAPGGVSDLDLSMGSLPLVAELPFTVVQTYSDKTVKRWGAAAGQTADGPAPVLTLTPAAANSAPNPNGTGNAGTMEGMAGMPGMAQGAPAGADTPAGQSDSNGSMKFFMIILVVGMLAVAVAGGWYATRKPQPDTDNDTKPDTDTDSTAGPDTADVADKQPVDEQRV